MDLSNHALLDVIKYEGNGESLVWKHPIEDIHLGSQLIVHESQEAVFFRDGQALDLFGSGRYTLETQELPILGDLLKLGTGGVSMFHSEIYYVNLATQMGIKWGTDSKVRLFDPASGLHIELGASGEFNIRVTDSRRLLIKIVGTADCLDRDALLGAENGKGFFRGLVMTYSKCFLAQAIQKMNISILNIDAYLMDLSNVLREKINVALAEYGLSMPEFFISRIVTPDDDPNFQRLKEQYAQQYLLVRQEQIKQQEALAAQSRKIVEAQTEAQMKVITAQGEAEAWKLQKAAETEAYRMQAEAEAQEMKLKGFTYQQQTSRAVGIEAMKNGIGGGTSGIFGDITGLGMALGAMDGVIGMTKEALSHSSEHIHPSEVSSSPIIWNCTCGQKELRTPFCPNCGTKRPEKNSAWNCPNCGTIGVTSNFCPNCGHKRST